jgi:hypothetical protein
VRCRCSRNIKVHSRLCFLKFCFTGTNIFSIPFFLLIAMQAELEEKDWAPKLGELHLKVAYSSRARCAGRSSSVILCNWIKHFNFVQTQQICVHSHIRVYIKDVFFFQWDWLLFWDDCQKYIQSACDFASCFAVQLHWQRWRMKKGDSLKPNLLHCIVRYVFLEI